MQELVKFLNKKNFLAPIKSYSNTYRTGSEYT